MKTDFSVHIHVDLGVTPELVALVNAVIDHRPMPTVEAPKPEPSASEQPEAAAPAKKRARKAATAEAPAPEVEAPEVEAPAEEAAPEPEPEAEAEAPAEAEPKELTEQDIRDAMHRTRQRIEGENYKDETDGELYKKYHRQLTSWFKNTAALLGSDKPSALITEKGQDEARQFIEECDRLEVLEDGTIGIKEAF
ncbi:MAG: hypothetical protein IKD78_14615 [Bacteroidales bacterium]|nr:hypothetical protein [Bacteroidales bacterium]